MPVFRYALEKWPAGRYEAVVFHKGALSAEQQAAVQLLRDAAEAEPPRANLKVELVDLSKEPAEESVEFYESLKVKQLPVATLRYPAAAKIDVPLWTAPLTTAGAGALLDSPARRKMAGEILKGTSAVWIFLKCGDAKKDEAAAQLVAKQLAHLQKTLKLPKLTDDPEDRLDNKHLPLELKFSMLTVDRTDPAEAALAAMLLNSEPDEPGETPLRDLKEPMVFPVYGRGRAMFGLIGQGITAENLRDAAKTVIGPCTCKVKEQNPGFDLLMAVSWDSALGEKMVKDVEPPLSGITKIKQPPKNGSSDPGSKPAPSENGAEPIKPNSTGGKATGNETTATSKQKATSPGMSAAPDTPEETSPTPTDSRNSPPRRPDDAGLYRNTLYGVGIGVAVVAAIYLLTRARSRRGM